MSREDVRFVTEFIDSLFPVSPAGVNFDAFVSNADVNDGAGSILGICSSCVRPVPS